MSEWLIMNFMKYQIDNGLFPSAFSYFYSHYHWSFCERFDAVKYTILVDELL